MILGKIPKRRGNASNQIVVLSREKCPWHGLAAADAFVQQGLDRLARQFVARAGFGSKVPYYSLAHSEYDLCVGCASHLENGFSIHDDN